MQPMEHLKEGIIRLSSTVFKLLAQGKERKPCKIKVSAQLKRARDGIRTRGPHLGKVVLHP